MNQRRGMILARIVCTFLTCLLALPLFAESAAPAQQRPNIVVFFMDDLGYGDLRVYGASDVKTPHLDRLAAEGVRLTDCYAAASLCTPTRAAFMTGRYQHRVGLENVLTEEHHDRGLSPSEPTLPRYLNDAGYATGLIGKWHLGSKSDFHPYRHGFDEFFGFLSGAVGYYEPVNAAGAHDLYENDRPAKLTTYLTDEIGTRAVSFVERHAGEPFFLDVAFNATHWPFEPPGLTHPPARPAGTTLQVVEQWAAGGTREDYVKMLERADAAIGRILDAIDRLGLRDRTLVILTSDNGGEWLSRMDPLTNRKGSLWEGGLRVPCILRWPKYLPAGHVSKQPAITMDLTATILSAGGVVVAANKPLDGVDLLPILSGRSAPMDRTFYWLSAWQNNPERAMRWGKWKYLAHTALFPALLFDLETDPAERNDLAAKNPAVLKKMKAMHLKWTQEVRRKPNP